jgi:hypothetical protein
VNADGVAAWLGEYDGAALLPDESPPAELRAIAAGAGVVVASDLLRARASAELLATPRVIECSPLLRETPLPIPALGALRLPPPAWGLVIFTSATLRRMRGVAPPAAIVKQGDDAATWLAGLAHHHGSVLAVTHVNVREHIAAALARAAWRRVPGGARFAPWSAWTFTR